MTLYLNSLGAKDYEKMKKPEIRLDVEIKENDSSESRFATRIIIIRPLIARRGSVSPLQSQP